MSESLTISRKDQLLAVSANLFKQKGYAATSMRDIASQLGLEAASIYHHVKSKEEILEILCFEMAHKLQTSLNEIKDIYFNAEDRLREAIKQHVLVITQYPEYSAVFIQDWKFLSENNRKKFITLRNEYESGFRNIVNDGIKENLFSNVDTKFAVLTILSALNWVIEWYKPNGKMSPIEIANKLSDFALQGLSKKHFMDLN